MEISSRPLRTPSHHSTHSQEAFIFPDVSSTPSDPHEDTVPPTAASSVLSFRPADDVSDLEASTSTLDTEQSGAMTPRAQPGTSQPSALSLLLARHDELARSDLEPPLPTESNVSTPTAERPTVMHRSLSVIREQPSGPVTSPSSSGGRESAHSGSSNETVPLLADLEANHRTYHANGDYRPDAVGKRSTRGIVEETASRVARGAGPVAKTALRSIPAVILGTLLNILDGISCTSSDSTDSFVAHQHW